jgi:hypothetical protein
MKENLKGTEAICCVRDHGVLALDLACSIHKSIPMLSAWSYQY